MCPMFTTDFVISRHNASFAVDGTDFPATEPEQLLIEHASLSSIEFTPTIPRSARAPRDHTPSKQLTKSASGACRRISAPIGPARDPSAPRPRRRAPGRQTPRPPRALCRGLPAARRRARRMRRPLPRRAGDAAASVAAHGCRVPRTGAESRRPVARRERARSRR